MVIIENLDANNLKQRNEFERCVFDFYSIHKFQAFYLDSKIQTGTVRKHPTRSQTENLQVPSWVKKILPERTETKKTDRID